MRIVQLSPPARIGLALTGLALLVGCTRLESVPRSEMRPGRIYPRCLVYLDDQTSYEFKRVSFRPDTLIGEYRVTVEHELEASAVVYEEVTRAFPLPLARIDSVAVIRRDPVKTLFYGAGIAAVSYALYELIDSDRLGQSSQNDGKPGQGGPEGK